MSKAVHGVEWAAGFFEGEGNIRLNVQNHANGRVYATLRLTLAQVNRDPLDCFRDVFDEGSVTGPYGPYSTTRQAHYQYAVSGPRAIEVAGKMRPYLLFKGEQVDRAIKQYEEWLNGR